MATERWWGNDAREIFWVEITDRAELGVDLAAQQLNEDGKRYWSHDLVKEVPEGDVVLHLVPDDAVSSGDHNAHGLRRIAYWSFAVGQAFESSLIWGARGEASGRGPVEPYERPAWRRPLNGPFPLERPVSMDDFRDAESAIRGIRDELRAQYPGMPLYFPFQLSEGRPVGTFQAYMAKMPRDLLLAVPKLAPLVSLAEQTRPTAHRPAPRANRKQLGVAYRRPDEDVTTRPERDPHSVDSNLIDRALHAHRRTQNLLHDAVLAAGLTPRSPAPGEPEFDIAWEDGDAISVAEVKSMSGTNEEKQLRLALGQVFRYAYLLGSKGRPVRRVIATERKPIDISWRGLCEEAGVTLVWPATFASLFDVPTPA